MIGGDRCYRDEYNDTNVYKTFFEPTLPIETVLRELLISRTVDRQR